MNRRKFLMGAAVTGIVAGSTMLLADEKPKKIAKHDCKGKNECKGQGGCSEASKIGKNDCKGQGGCSMPKAKKKK